MSYRLEICHPNEFLQGKWQFVETVGEDWINHLRSPSFDIYPGLMVRVGLSLYLGIYNDTECVDVGSNSQVTRNLSKYHLNFLFNRSFPEAWAQSHSPIDMMSAILPLVSTRRLFDACAASIKYSVSRMSMLSSQFYKIMNIAIDYDREFTEEEWSSLIRMQESTNNQQSLVEALQFLRLFRNSMVLSNAISVMDSVQIEANDYIFEEAHRRKLADLLRREVPFHEIAEGLVR